MVVLEVEGVTAEDDGGPPLEIGGSSDTDGSMDCSQVCCLTVNRRSHIHDEVFIE